MVAEVTEDNITPATPTRASLSELGGLFACCSGERLLAGGGCAVDGCTPAKPPWSEVIIILVINCIFYLLH